MGVCDDPLTGSGGSEHPHRTRQRRVKFQKNTHWGDIKWASLRTSRGAMIGSTRGRCVRLASRLRACCWQVQAHYQESKNLDKGFEVAASPCHTGRFQAGSLQSRCTFEKMPALSALTSEKRISLHRRLLIFSFLTWTVVKSKIRSLQLSAIYILEGTF